MKPNVFGSCCGGENYERSHFARELHDLYPVSKGFFLACMKSFASLVFRVVDFTRTTSYML